MLVIFLALHVVSILGKKPTAKPVWYVTQLQTEEEEGTTISSTGLFILIIACIVSVLAILLASLVYIRYKQRNPLRKATCSISEGIEKKTSIAISLPEQVNDEERNYRSIIEALWEEPDSCSTDTNAYWVLSLESDRNSEVLTQSLDSQSTCSSFWTLHDSCRSGGFSS